MADQSDTLLTFTEQVALSGESIWTDALVRARLVDAFGVDAARVGTAAFVDVQTLLIGNTSVSGWTRALETAIDIGALGTLATRIGRTLIHVCVNWLIILFENYTNLKQINFVYIFCDGL